MKRLVRRCCMGRWPCARRRCRCGPVVFFCTIGAMSFILSIASFAFAFRHQLFDMFVKCEEKESLDYINDYCQAYREGKITGSLCQPLCESRQVQFSQCTDFHAGKRVSIMSCTDFCIPGESVSAVLKYPNDNVSTVLFAHPESFPDDGQSGNFHQHTNKMIRDMLKWELGFLPFPSDANMTELMWEKESSKYIKTPAEARVAFRTIMMLMDQTEYRVVKALESSSIVPWIYGTCGPLYLQESCPPGLLDEVTVSFTDPNHVPVPWKQKATVIIQLLRLIQQLEQDFPQVLHLCDVKGTNFGVCMDGSVKVIDADTVFFHTRMMDTFRTSMCKTHGDCNFFDCGSWCQTDTGTCYTVITNNNLQTVCRDVLFNQLPKVFGGGSIFHDAPPAVAPKLKATLNECLSQTSEELDRIPVHKPPLSVLTRLIRLLEQSLTETDPGL